ncbi:MAG: hypothetical protein J1F33_04940 [Clostridiales bacterium]|nr:hypothetical protein [Clostridiales bacterium]
MERTKKKKNIIVRYFTPFGLKQTCDMVMLVGFVLLIVGLCTNEAVLLAGFICYCVGALASVALCVKILVTTKNHRDPAFKNALINVAIMGVLFALSLFGLLWTVLG